MATRLNVNSATREELIDVIRRLNTRVNDMQAQIKAQQQQLADQKHQHEVEVDRLQHAAAATTATSSAGGVSGFFSSWGAQTNNSNEADGRTPRSSGGATGTAKQQQQQQNGDDERDMAFARIASLETELESERQRYKEDMEIMQKQIDELTIRAADDAEAIEKLRGAADDMKRLVRQKEEEQQVMHRAKRENPQQKERSRFDEPASVVDDVAASFTTALSNLADERDAAYMRKSQCEIDARELRLALEAERAKRDELEATILRLAEENSRLLTKSNGFDRRIQEQKTRALERYNKLYARFVLLRKRFEGELVNGPKPNPSVSSASINNAAPQQQQSQQQQQSAASSTRHSRASSRSSSSSSSSSTPSKSSAASNSSSNNNNAVAESSRTPVASMATAAGSGGLLPARKAVVFNAAQLVNVAEDDDDDDDHPHHHVEAAMNVAAAVSSTTAPLKKIKPSLPSNGSFDAGPVVGFHDDEPEHDSAAAPEEQRARTAINIPVVVPRAETCDAEVQTASLNDETVATAVVVAAVAAQKDAFVQCELLQQQQQQQQQQAQPVEVSSPEPRAPIVSHPSSSNNDGQLHHHLGGSVGGGGGSSVGSVAFDHDVQLLANWDAEDLRTLRRFLRC